MSEEKLYPCRFCGETPKINYLSELHGDDEGIEELSHDCGCLHAQSLFDTFDSNISGDKLFFDFWQARNEKNNPFRGKND